MKKWFSNYIFPFAVCFLIALALYPNIIDADKYSTDGLELDYTLPDGKPVIKKPSDDKKDSVFTPHLGKSFEAFKEAVAFKESQGNYFTVNEFGYMGKYQFGEETLKVIGIYNPNYFLNTPELQEKAFIANTKRNKWILRKDIERYVGKTIGGVNVTESGILAAAHLAGPGNVKRFLRSNGQTNFADGFGSTVKYYMKRFEGYNTSSIEPDKSAKARL